MDLRLNILNFDIYAKKASFFYKNQEKIGSCFGLFLTILYIFFSIILFAYYLIVAIRRKEMQVYDSSLYAQEKPIININKDYFNFAFGLENPNTLNKFVDESIYIPEVSYIDRIKVDGEFHTITNKNLPLEKCKQEEFGDNYQHLLIEGELSNSYCLKDFDYNITFAGGFKYERMSYLRIKIFPCKNTTENNNQCKPQEKLDEYMTSGYFSILLKDIGLNPSNFTDPITPTLQDLYTTIDRRLHKNYILNFGLTQIQTDIGFFNEQTKVEKFIQFHKEFQTFTFRDISEYLSGKDIILIQIRLDDNILIQKRKYTKISEILSRIGGYMQLMYTVFLLMTIYINKIDSELKIVNSIFNFNLKQNKMVLKLRSLKTINSMAISKSNKHLILPFKNQLKSIKTFNLGNKSNNNLLTKNNFNNLKSSSANIYVINRNNNNQHFKINVTNNIKSCDGAKNKSINSKVLLDKTEENNSSYLNKNMPNITNDNSLIREHKENLFKENLFKENNDQIKITIFDYFCHKYSPKKTKMIELYHFGNEFYRKRMDIVLVFSHLLLTEKVLLSNNYQDITQGDKDIEITYSKI
jgi:hypothetical protein